MELGSILLKANIGRPSGKRPIRWQLWWTVPPHAKREGMGAWPKLLLKLVGKVKVGDVCSLPCNRKLQQWRQNDQLAASALHAGPETESD